MVVGAIPGQVVLDSLGNQVEQAMGNNSLSSTPPESLEELLPLGSFPI